MGESLMKAEERDQLLIRLDEKTANIYKLTEQQEKHLTQLNEKVSKNVLRIAEHDFRIDTIEKGMYLKLNKGQMAVGGGTVFSLVMAAIIAVGKTFGWW